jgi:hypothetical protein
MVNMTRTVVEVRNMIHIECTFKPQMEDRSIRCRFLILPARRPRRIDRGFGESAA